MGKIIAAVLALLALPVLAIPPLTTALFGGTNPGEVEGIPPRLLDAYLRAAAALTEMEPQCTGMRWQILAGIGSIESSRLAGHNITATGEVSPPMIGPTLDGSGVGGNTTPHYDTDDGEYDRDTVYDHAVGPNQHLPSGWDTFGADGNGDGAKNPHNVYDSALASARELCLSAGGTKVDFTRRDDLSDALFRYNRSHDYVNDVLAEIDRFDTITPTRISGGGAGSKSGRDAAQWAVDQVGKPYIWGGTGPSGYDCSGLTMKAWEAAGKNLPRVTTDQYRHGNRVGLDELVPGDLLFYDTTDVGSPGPAPSHVTMYIGGGKMVNAPSSGKTIRIEPVQSDFYSPRIMGAVRPS